MAATFLPLQSSPSARRRRLWLGNRAYWACQFTGWIGNILYGIGLTTARGEPHPFRRVFPWAVICLGGFLVSHPLRAGLLILRDRWSGWRLVSGVAGNIVAASAVGAILIPPAFPLLFGAVFPGQPVPPRPQYLAMFNELMFALTGWVGLYFAITSYRDQRQAAVERARLESALKEAELRALRSQLNPHFLFNSLNLLRALIPRELNQPRDAVTLLAGVLRASLTMGENTTIPLARELETVESYLGLEQLRHGVRLQFTRQIEPATLDWPVPPFLVQSLLENAVKFGVARREEGGEVSLTAAVRDGALHLEITNPGRIDAASESTGLGLKNLRLRLEHLYGAAGRLELAQRTPDLVAAEVLVPMLADAT